MAYIVDLKIRDHLRYRIGIIKFRESNVDGRNRPFCLLTFRTLAMHLMADDVGSIISRAGGNRKRSDREGGGNRAY